MEPHDVSDLQDKGMRTLALLAHNLGWRRASAKGIAIYHSPKDQHELRLPTNTSIRMSVFQSRLNSLITHSDQQLTSVLVDEVLSKVKPSATHVQRLRAVVPVEQLELPVEEKLEEAEMAYKKWQEIKHKKPETAAAEFAIVDAAPTPEEAVTEHTQLWNDEIAAPATPEGVEQPVKKEPYVVRYGRKGRADRGGAVYRSNFIEVWTWADGHKSLHCPYCGESRETSNGVAIHARSIHPDLIPERRSEWVTGVEVTYDPSQYQDRKPSEAEEMITLIRDLIGTDDTLITALTMERDEWERRALKAEGDIQALKELLRDE